MTRYARPLAVAMAVATLAFLAAGIVIAAVAKARGADVPEDAWSAVALAVGIGTPACVGLVLVLRRPTRGLRGSCSRARSRSRR